MSRIYQSWAVLEVIGYLFNTFSTGTAKTEYLKYMKGCSLPVPVLSVLFFRVFKKKVLTSNEFEKLPCKLLLYRYRHKLQRFSDAISISKYRKY